MLTKTQKKKVIEDLADKIKRQKSLIFTDINRVNVAKTQDLRRKLREGKIEYKVAKKTLIDLALKKEKQKIDISQFNGSLALAFSYDDPILPARILTKFAKENEALRILGGIMEDRVLTIEDIKQLAKIPSKSELLAELVWSLKAPVSRLVNLLQGNIYKFVNLLKLINK